MLADIAPLPVVKAKRTDPDRRGLHCPKCGTSVQNQLVAKSYPIDGGGHRRTRYCGKCHTEVVTVEWVVGDSAAGVMLVHGLTGRLASALKQTAQALGGKATKL